MVPEILPCVHSLIERSDDLTFVLTGSSARKLKRESADRLAGRALRPKGPLDRPSEIGGAALEGLVYQHLTAWNDYGSGENSLHFWRTKAGVEVDFIVYGPSAFHAIEVKNTDKVTRHDAAGLEAFHAD